jgi:trimeric autotransporter adhesin
VRIIYHSLALAFLIGLSSAGIAAAQAGSDVCVGVSANIGGTCMPLINTTSGDSGNVAIGGSALFNNTTGADNVGAGSGALFNNTTGGANTAAGSGALRSNTTGAGDTAAGSDALFGNTTGAGNTATGSFALEDNTTGSNNVGIGQDGGFDLTTGDNNIDIGNSGVGAESNTIRIGTVGTQTATFIAGIFNAVKEKKACDVTVDKAGQLGCIRSSARYKRDIRDMGDASDKLMKLRPVTFRYKADSTSTQQYGLIAEEVEKVYPELVIDDANGKAEMVTYQVLPAMLLNEVQKQARADQRMARQLAQKDAEIAALQHQLSALQKKYSEVDAMAERINALEQQARKATTPEHLASTMR